ncbi:VOC family protein [Occultella gossypii]|uniref:VOC family protein n=1 Tax=Occultella gossypii TaxID=2800820 RepID=A0ABS7SEU8_9MICO|nr:VOC family protein [Occultella gossypii]MBZ2197816.1 VOC family protein [Occultella gossypii]
MSVPAILDHLVLAGPSLAELVSWFTEATGVEPVPGGTHPTGTANALVAFTVAGRRGPHYLELIGPDPDRTTTGPVTTFGIDERDAPGLATFAVHPDDIEETVARAASGGHDTGAIRPLSRTKPDGEVLSWRLTRVLEGRPDPVLPFLIDWGTTRNPGQGDLPTVELEAMRGRHPDAARARQVLDLLGVDLAVDAGEEPALTAVVRGAHGDLELS